MTNTQPNTPAPQPAQAAPSEPLIELKVEGQTWKEPLSKVVERAQKAEAVDRRLQEIAAQRQTLSQAQQIHQQEVAFAARFRDMMARDPDALVAEVARMARVAKGGDVAVPGAGAEQHSEGGDQQPQGYRDNPALLAKLREVEDRLNAVQTETSVDRLTREIGSELDRYDVFKDPASPVSKEAREQAEFLMRALRAAQPNAPLSDLASQVHGRIQTLITQKAQSTYDSRVATAAAVPAINTQGGTPSLSLQEPEVPKADWLKGGGAKARGWLQQMAGRIAPTR